MEDGFTTERSSKGAFTLERRYFASSELFEAEQQKIFSRNWLCVGREEKISSRGDFIVHEMGEESIIVVRDQQDRVRAFHNVCRHRGTRLCSAEEGRFSRTIQCPYHAWTYALDGRLIGAPTMQGNDRFSVKDYPLVAVSVALWEGFVFINLDPNPIRIELAFQPLMDRFAPWKLSTLKIARRIDYDIRANWKLIFQNYSECYHCPTLHPSLNSLTPYQNSHNDLEEGPFLGGPMRLATGCDSMTMSGRSCAPPLVATNSKYRQLVYYYTIFPTMFLSLHPDYVLVHRLEPRATDETRVICEWLFAPHALELADTRIDDAVEFWDMTNKQDWRICELSQRGINSRAYQPGPYADLESVLVAFDEEYLRQIEEGE